MPRTLLLALIVTALTACNKSEEGKGLAKVPDNIRKLPKAGSGEGNSLEAIDSDSALAH